MKKGFELIKDRRKNKSTAFDRAERDEKGLRGILPYAVSTQDLQVERIVTNVRRQDTEIDKYLALYALMHRNDRLYYKVIMENIEEMLPIIYTPTVGQACKEFSHLFSLPKGFYITPEDKGQISDMLDNWNYKRIKVIVVTDGERILGLGDLGANGMGIPIGKLSLYTAFGGIDPSECLPVMFDVGTNNEELRADPLYLGYPHPRVKGAAYDELMDEFITAVKNKYPGVLVQFEDFLTPNAYRLLKKYRKELLCFNDDIQGTAAVTLAGVQASTRITGKSFKDLNILFLGAGSAATGIADLMRVAYIKEGLTEEEALSRLNFCDRNGLVVKSRTDLASHKLPYAQDKDQMDFMSALKLIKPDVLIGATGTNNTFNEEVIGLMSEYNERPLIFALSNPTSRAECTAEEAYVWSKGKAIFVSGSPFDPVEFEGKTFVPGQGNNAYIFPGLGLGLLASQAKEVDESLLISCAESLAEQLSQEQLDSGTMYPSLKNIREVSLELACNVAKLVFEQGLTTMEKPQDLKKHITDLMYDPNY